MVVVLRVASVGAPNQTPPSAQQLKDHLVTYHIRTPLSRVDCNNGIRFHIRWYY